jgi:hypothetical protein
MSLASRGITYLSKVCQYGFSRWYLRKSQILRCFEGGKNLVLLTSGYPRSRSARQW